MDNLANSFSKIQNSQMRRQKIVFLKFSKITWNICTVLYVEGFLQGFERKDQHILIYLKYFQDKPVINKISKISLQGRRVYTKSRFSPFPFKNAQSIPRYAGEKRNDEDYPAMPLKSASVTATEKFIRHGHFDGPKSSDLSSSQIALPVNFSRAIKHSSHVAKGLGIKILSTSRGIFSERDARFFGIGGEIICEVF